MSRHLPSTSVVQSLEPPLQAIDETLIAELVDASSRPIAGARIDAGRCMSLVPAIDRLLAGRATWEVATSHATRLVTVLPSSRSAEMDSALVIVELAKAFCAYPPAIAADVANELMARLRFRPVPAEVHEAAKARVTALSVARAMAERVQRAEEMRRAEAERLRAEEDEERLARAENRETPSERRRRIAAEAMALVAGRIRSEQPV